MTISTLIVLLPALLGLAASAPPAEEPVVRTIIVEEQIIMRVPVRPARPSVDWVERDGPECVPTESIRGAALSQGSHVDFLLRGRKRMRAELAEDCPGLDFWNGFYLAPEGESICAGRDSIRSRMGGSCRIERFHRLVPVKR